ncbi:hypothetical protein SAMN02745164_01911 [Marinitoga hydrogenitolerans DSM 16785]|uniref:Uncharacterized protein n=1 Tax=Marinitoga hydrogenitolerans (strain DSM 16785 / JCM 12826 / AT1271) TaxID=1122195 RepID=A0A1M4ZEU8_MARH1|nr:DUF6063 family protein [Marinitoga hydrogenitolerans]SHF16327.1 hypothetical protein SAMN02745164_01911 [Marinitoga hydrogenitolerans DSM 16785]
MENIEYAMAIISKLIEKTEISEKDNRELIHIYFNNDQIKTIVEIFAEKSNLTLYESPSEDYICIIPKSSRSIYAYNKDDIYRKYKLDQKSYMIFMFYTFCILYIFNDLQEISVKLDKVYEIAEEQINKVKNDLEKENINKKYNWNFKGLVKIWDEMKEISKTSTTEIRGSIYNKKGLLKKTVKILDSEKILEYIEGNIDAIKITEKTHAVLMELSKNQTYLMLKKYFENN